MRFFARHAAALLLCSTLTLNVFAQENSPAASTSPLQAQIQALGELNGVALACGQFALSTRIKDILVQTAPKEREIGEWFEQSTQQAFLNQGNQRQNCPSSRTLAEKIDAAGKALRNTSPAANP